MFIKNISHQEKKGALKWQLQKQLLRRVEGIITDSVHSKKDIANLVGVSAERIHVIPLAPAEHFKKITSENKINQILEKYKLPEKFVLYVGDVTWNKNLPRLLRALSGTDIQCVMVGKALTENNFDRSNLWNMDRVEIQALVSQNNNISLLGFLSDEELVSLYNKATAFVFPSLSEGFGLPVLEAMSCGAPVITAREGSLPEVAGDAAFYINAHNIEDIRAGIKKVFNDISLQEKLRYLGYEQVKKFSWKKTAEMTNNVYSKIVQK